jgi:hypothetical protein
LYIIIVRNSALQHLDLTNTGLNAITIYKLCVVVAESPSLQAVHFSGNPGVTPDLRLKVRQLFGAPEQSEPPYPVKFVSALQDGKATGAQKKRQVADALLLKGINETLDMETGRPKERTEAMYGRKLLIQRNIGVTDVCAKVSHGSKGCREPQAWRVDDSEQAECWICHKQQLIIVLWNKHVGEAGLKEMEQHSRRLDTSTLPPVEENQG